MKIPIDCSNLVNKAFAALLYMEVERIKKDKPELKDENKDKLKELALTTINKEFVLHTSFNMIDTILIVLSGKLDDIVLVFDDYSWRKKFLEDFNSKEFHEINGKKYKLNNSEIYYKAGRKKVGQDIIHDALDDMIEIAKKINMKNFKRKNFEADDLIGLITFALKDEDEINISSNDKDFYQLMIQENVQMYNSTTKEILKFSVDEAKDFFRAKLLMKDASDNIGNIIPEFKYNSETLPGMMLGEVTAHKLSKEFGNIPDILNHISSKIFNNQEKYFKKLNSSSIKEENKESERFMKKSLIIDNNDNPIKLFHGTNEDFDNFDNKYIGEGNDQLGSGFYFTNNKETAKGYGENVKEVYLNIKNPILEDSKELTLIQIKELITKAPKYKKTLEDFADFKDPNFDLEKTIEETAKNYFNMELLYTLNTLSNDFYNNNEYKFLKNVTKITGYDGLVSKVTEDETHYVVFDSKQIKNSNECNFSLKHKNPNTLEDIRNVVEIYFNRNKKMMDFKSIPKDLVDDFNEYFNLDDFNNQKVVDNKEISKVFEEYKLNNLSKKYSSADEDLYSDMK